MNNQNCYIEFKITEDQKFEDLRSTFEKFIAVKNGGGLRNDEYWFKAFPDYVKKKFYFTDSDLRPDFETSKLSDDVWHFYSLVNLMQIDYDVDYRDCSMINTDEGRLEFYPYNYPYGGLTGLLIFIKSFDCIPYKVDEGSGVFQIKWKSDNDFELTEI